MKQNYKTVILKNQRRSKYIGIPSSWIGRTQYHQGISFSQLYLQDSVESQSEPQQIVLWLLAN